jgi:hypothetical protein
VVFNERWTAPVEITPQLRDEAEAGLRSLRVAMQPPPAPTMRKWLATLGTLTAGKVDAEDAATRIDAFVGMLDYPAQCFTKRTLDAAARRFRWFPSFAELAEFLDEQAAPLRTLADRLEQLLQVPATALPGPAKDKAAPLYRDLTPEQQAEHDRLMRSFRETTAPERKRPEISDETPAQRAVREVAAQLGRQWHQDQESQGRAA